MTIAKNHLVLIGAGLLIGFVIGFTIDNNNNSAYLGTGGPSSMAGMNHGNNSFMMRNVTSERMFVEDMIPHHEAAVMMAEQVLLLNPRPEVKKLAEDIINTQVNEINMMKGWLKRW